MPLTERRPAALPDPSRVSALVVGAEWYPGLKLRNGQPVTLAGAARSAERFVEWLIDREICLPERITLMMTVNPGQTTATRLANVSEGVRNKINWLDDVDPDVGIERWLTGGLGPSDTDRLFLLFWVGHGFTDPDDADRRLFLLGSNATEEKLRNVTLTQVLHNAGKHAPHADVAAFVNACRVHVPGDLVRKLESGTQTYKSNTKVTPDPHRRESIAYAAAHGLTTRQTGWEHETFADTVLTLLEAPDAGPFTIFDGGLDEVVEAIRFDEAGTFDGAVCFQHGRARYRFNTDIDPDYLTRTEWQNLVTTARKIDQTRNLRTGGPVRWGAYSHAMSSLDVDQVPDEMKTVMDVIRSLRDQPPLYPGAAPPIFIACDFLANLPGKGKRPGLAKWCKQWADERGDEGPSLLAEVDRRRPKRLLNRPCLTITVADGGSLPEEASLFSLKPRLYVLDKPIPLPERSGVPREKIPDEAYLVIADALDRQVAKPHELLVEFVVPRELRRWRFEHHGNRPLGVRYAVAVRSLDLAQGQLTDAEHWINSKLEEIEAFEPATGAQWSDMIDWFTCEERHTKTPDETMMSTGSSPGERFCIGLGRRDDPAANRDVDMMLDAPMGLDHAIENGASPIILAMLEALGCNDCVALGGCAIARGKQRVNDAVDDRVKYANGLLDLPYIVRDIRVDFVKQNHRGMHFGVFMENRMRLKAERSSLRSQRNDLLPR